jgi:hypothetical protein
MFDRYCLSRGPSSVSVRVDEHRAPTDESVRLLKEMEEKAEARVLDRARVGNNVVEGSAVLFANPTGIDNTLVLLFRINGRDFQRRVSVPASWALSSKEALLDKLTEAMASEVLLSLRLDGIGGVR